MDNHRGNQAGYHRRSEHKFYRDIEYPITMSDFRPGDILLSSSRSFIGMGIRLFSQVDGKRASVNHCAQIIRKNGILVASEALYPTHSFTKIADILSQARRGKVRLTLVRLNRSLWATDAQQREATALMNQWHLTLEGRRYTVAALVPLALWSMVRNLTPLVRGKYNSIPVQGDKDVLYCSWEIDMGWADGQVMTKTDFFPSSLGPIPSPEDILTSPHVSFVSGWRRERLGDLWMGCFYCKIMSTPLFWMVVAVREW